MENLEKRARPLGFWLGAGILVAVTILSLTVRGYRLGDIQPHHDEYPMFGFTKGRVPVWNGSLDGFARTICDNAVLITESDSTTVGCLVAELFRWFFGDNLLAARWFHAILQSIGVGIVAWMSWRLFSPCWPAVAAVSILGIVSVPSIIYGQFGEMYAIYFLASCVQLTAYLHLLWRRKTWPAYLGYTVTAVICGYFEYLQVFVFAGLILFSVLDSGLVPRWRRLGRASSMLGIYGLLNLPFVNLFFLTNKLNVGFRPYLWHYYPGRAFDAGTIGAWTYYYVVQVYDFLNYHFGLIYDSTIYRPLAWNWAFAPLLLLFLLGLGALFFPFRCTREWVRSARRMAVLFLVFLVVLILGNLLYLVPLGGVRNTICLAPVLWLSYGTAVVGFWRWVDGGRRISKLPAGLLVVAPLVLLAFSWKGLYSDRVSNLDLVVLERAIEESRADTVVMPQASYWPFLQVLQAHPDFVRKYPPGGKVRFHSFEEMEDENWGNYPRPVPGEKILALDLNLSADCRYEGKGITIDHPSLKELCGPDWEIIPIVERPGPHVGVEYHQSIYYPPNSFYLYRLRLGGEDSPR